ncbi:unnamed protein product [Anisakis simplex]|uniref:Serine-rich adhesin for platelets n=1 Tax=Anisakis simplex TaxID=6269 RepID=A0A0M3KC79_ANISI|nr:unnamed protein product [Anisakis simplex]
MLKFQDPVYGSAEQSDDWINANPLDRTDDTADRAVFIQPLAPRASKYDNSHFLNAELAKLEQNGQQQKQQALDQQNGHQSLEMPSGEEQILDRRRKDSRASAEIRPSLSSGESRPKSYEEGAGDEENADSDGANQQILTKQGVSRPKSTSADESDREGDSENLQQTGTDHMTASKETASTEYQSEMNASDNDNITTVELSPQTEVMFRSEETNETDSLRNLTSLSTTTPLRQVIIKFDSQERQALDHRARSIAAVAEDQQKTVTEPEYSLQLDSKLAAAAAVNSSEESDNYASVSTSSVTSSYSHLSSGAELNSEEELLNLSSSSNETSLEESARNCSSTAGSGEPCSFEEASSEQSEALFANLNQRVSSSEHQKEMPLNPKSGVIFANGTSAEKVGRIVIAAPDFPIFDAAHEGKPAAGPIDVNELRWESLGSLNDSEIQVERDCKENSKTGATECLERLRNVSCLPADSSLESSTSLESEASALAEYASEQRINLVKCPESMDLTILAETNYTFDLCRKYKIINGMAYDIVEFPCRQMVFNETANATLSELRSTGIFEGQTVEPEVITSYALTNETTPTALEQEGVETTTESTTGVLAEWNFTF